MEKKTFCRICDVGCGLIATVEDGKIISIRPNPDHVVSKGFACKKGLKYHEIVHSPDRVTAPQKRRGAKWETVGWDAALKEIGSEIKRIQKEYGPDSVALYVGNGAGFGFLHPFFAQALLIGLGSDSAYSSATQDCSNKFITAQHMYGFPMTQPVPDFENAGCFLIMGANPYATKMSFRGVPDVMNKLKEASERGCRIININPRKTETVRAGGEHHYIRPDTDIFFLLALANELIKINAVDHRKVSRYMKNFDKFRDAIRNWTPEKAAEVTGIAEETIREIARTFADADGSSIYCSTGINMGRNGALTFWVSEAINAMTGNLDRKGGTTVNKGLVDFPKMGAKNRIMMTDKTSRIGGFKAVNDLFPGSLLADEILTPGGRQIKALIVAAGNPLLTLPDTAKTEKAFKSLELLVSVDIFRNMTGNLSHYILPGITPFEHADINYLFHSLMGITHRRFYQYTDRLIPPLGEAKDELWIYQELCRHGGGKFFGSRAIHYWLHLRRFLRKIPLIEKGMAFSHEQILDMVLKLSRKKGIKRMRRHPDGVLLPQYGAGTFLGKRVYTEDGLVNLAPDPMLEAMEKLEEEWQWEKKNSRKLKLINMRQLLTHNTFMQNAPSLVEGRNNSNYLYLNPSDGEKAGFTKEEILRGGSREAEVYNETGSITVPVIFTEDMMPGSAAIPFGWGHQSADGLSRASQTGGANVNYLIPSGTDHVERLSLMAHLSGVIINVRPAGGAKEK
ncbi:molybdopterin-containing oxidoreductase family protein [Spirochaeta isovalerica]|uniref:Anaerobic selenocysteine-containing dehydrogenase n=1 Tax=Spirochaeta isovalerica TaxID=150 RepID=A0A841RBH3_9SPIO|nr:molybdopterin-dependent oxidoreductase [Spirochaeta isovalerica]MBB6480028.1 anaerobic selenocysteine-containing dehydrogenase [Spirochaeta isovalerica]